MIQQRFALLTLLICLLTLNVFAQKNTTIQPEVKQVKSTEQAQSKVIMHTTKKEVTPLYQRVTKTEAATENKASTPAKIAAQPIFSSTARPNIYKNLDANIQKTEQKIAKLEADPNHDESILIKHRANLKRMQEIKAEKPAEH